MRILSLTQTMRRLPAIPPARGRGLALAALSLILLGGTAACGSDGGTGPGADIAGTYALRQINKVALPMSEDYSWGIDSFDGGSLRLEADGTWSLEIRGGSSFDGGFPAPWTVTDFGEFEHDGVNLGFSSASADVQFSGSWNGESVTIHYNWDPYFAPDPETEFVFER